MKHLTVMNMSNRRMDKSRICGAKPPERRQGGCLTVSLFNGRVCSQIRALSRQRSRKSSTVGYSAVCEALTEMGPGRNKGNSGVSVKPPLPVSPAAQPRAFQEFLVTFVSKTKVTRPSACVASGAKQCLADFAPAKPCLSIRTKFANLQLWVTRRFPKPSPKRDRTITKATAVSPLSPRCPSVLRPNRVLLKEFLVTFVSKTKVTRPSACVASGAKWSEEHTSELQSRGHLVCRLLLEKKKK